MMPSTLAFAFTSALLLAPAFAQTTLQIPASADNTLYQDPTGALSNALGQYLFCGVSGQPTSRRAVLQFDIAAALPAGARVLTAELHLNVSRAGAQTNLQIDVHRITGGAWGEGNSMALGNEGGGGSATPGDVTWLHRSYNGTLWATQGGDFAAVPSTTAIAPVLGAAVWPSSAGMVADVQQFLEQPSTNQGWLLKSNELLATEVRRFDSRQNLVAANQPYLQVTFVAPGSTASVGSGCVGSNNLPLQLAVTGSPAHGGSFALAIHNGIAANFGANALALGLAATPLPLGPGCDFLLDGSFGITVLGLHQFDGGGNATDNINVPNNPALFGFSIAAQALGLDAGVPLGVVASNAVVLVVN